MLTLGLPPRLPPKSTSEFALYPMPGLPVTPNLGLPLIVKCGLLLPLPPVMGLLLPARVGFELGPARLLGSSSRSASPAACFPTR
jgi:hypothetical protein